MATFSIEMKSKKLKTYQLRKEGLTFGVKTMIQMYKEGIPIAFKPGKSIIKENYENFFTKYVDKLNTIEYKRAPYIQQSGRFLRVNV